MSAIRLLVLFGCIVLITACGGGGGGSDNNGSDQTQSSDSGNSDQDSSVQPEAGGEGSTGTGNTSDSGSTSNSGDAAMQPGGATPTFQAPRVISLWSQGVPFGEGRIIDDTISFSGTAEPHHIIELWLNGVMNGSTVVNGQGEWSLDFTRISLSPGSYSVDLVSNSPRGERVESERPFLFRYDPTAPAAPVITGISDDSYIGGDGYTTDGTVIVSGTVEPGLTVTLYLDNVAIGSTVSDVDGNWVVDHSAVDLADGSYMLTADAVFVDLQSAISSQFPVTVDRLAPSVPTGFSVSPDTGSSSTDAITSVANLIFSGVAEPGAHIRLRLGSLVIGGTDADASGNWTFDYSGIDLADGSYDVASMARDQAGNTSGWSVPTVVTIDTIPPAPVSSIQLQPDTGVFGDRITATGAIQLVGTSDPNHFVEVFIDGISAGTVSVDSNGDWLLDLAASPLVDGNYIVTTRVQDMAGNLSTISGDFPVTINTQPPAVPTITGIVSDTGVGDDALTADNSPSVQGMSDAGTTLHIYLDGVLLGSTTTDISGNWNYVYGSTPLADGAYVLTAIAENTAGVQSAPSPAFPVQIDTVAPAAPLLVSISDDTAVASDGITADNSLLFNGVAEPNSTIEMFVDGVSRGTQLVDGAGDWLFDLTGSPFSDGIYTLGWQTTDLAGNASTLSVSSLQIDTSAPSVPVVNSITDDTGAAGDFVTSDTTLVLTGSSDATVTVELFMDGVSQGVTNSDPSGNWTFDLSSSVLADGVYTITASSQDIAGNTSSLSVGRTITIDASAPAAVVIAAITTDSAITTDGITNDNTLVIEGTSEADNTVEVFVDGASIGSTVADGAGIWSYDYTGTAMTDGRYAFTAEATDLSGNTSILSTSFDVTVDTIAPADPFVTTITDDTGTAADGITSDTFLIFGGTAEASASVEVFLDAVSIGTTTADATGNWSFDYTATPLPEGSYVVAAQATDIAGNASAISTAFDITIDTSAPAAPTVSAVSDDTAIAADGVTSDNTLLIAGVAETNVTVEVFVDAVSVGSTTVDGAGNWSYDYSGTTLSDGSYSITAQATDIVGNVSASSAAFDITVDTSAPSAPGVTTITDDTGTAADDGITSDTTLVFSGTTEANSVVEVFVDTGSIGTTTADATGNWSYDYSGTLLPEGSHSISAQATDVAGNVSLLSSAMVITVDVTAPVAPTVTSISDDTGTAGDGLTSDTTLVFNGTAEADALVEVFIDSISIGTTNTDGAGNWIFDYSGATLIDGNYRITVQAIDAAGNISPSSIAFDITVDSSAPAAPVVSSISDDTGTAADGTTSDTTLMFSGTAEANAAVEVFVDAVSIGTTNADAVGNWTFDYTSTVLTDATYVVTAIASDASGNNSSASANYNVTVDTTAPEAPTVASISSDTGNVADGITGDNTLQFVGTAEPNASVEVFIDGSSIGTVAAGAGGIWSYDHTATVLTDGDYTITAQASDNAGNVSVISAGFAISVDTSIPAAPSVDAISDDTATVADGVTSDPTLVFSGTADANTTVEVFIDAASIGSVTADGAGNWMFDNTGTTLADGNYAVTATSEDAAANISVVSSALNITVDTDTPDISALTPGNGVTSVSFASDLAIGFDEVVFESAGNIVLRYNSDSSVVESFDITGALVTGTGTSTITINPSADLYGGTQYYLEMDANSYVDLAGNNFAGIAGNTTWLFTTVDTAVLSSTPADEGVGVALNTSITLNFNEAVSVNGGNVRIRRVSDDATIETIDITSGQVTGSGSSTITIAQSGVLDPNTAYYVEIDSGAVINGNNVSFNGISGNSSLNFTTENVTTPTVTNVSSTIANGNYRGNDTVPIEITFSEIVNVTGSPQILINLDAADKYINYTSGSGTNILQFDYVVTTGDSKYDLGYVSTNSLVLNGGTVRSANNANANLTLPTPGGANSLSLNKNINIVAAELDLTNMNSGDGFIVEGYENNDELGRAVGGTGDVNGDGYEDFIIGNELSDIGGSDAGVAYVIYGKAGATRANIDLSAFSASDGITISRGVTWENVGTSVFIGGDLNGDGYDEIIVANSGDDNTVTSDVGRLYIIWGKASPTNVNMNSFGSADGFIVEGYEASDFLGKHSGSYLDNNQFFDSEGDFNGDGIDDLLIGHSLSDEGGSNSGVAYVIFGAIGATRSNITLNNIGSEGFSITTDTGSNSFFGHSVEFVEDFNGDGYNDILIGAPHSPEDSSSGGEAYIIFGHGGPAYNNIDMGALSPTEGFQISVSDFDNWMGGSVSSADVNGDGLSDVLIAHSGDLTSRGAFAVLYGFVSASYADIGWSNIASTGGYYFVGEGFTDYFAHALEAIGDINGDGISDMLATSWSDREGGDYAGAAWVIYGETGTARSTENLSSLNSNDGFKIIGDWGLFGSGDNFGKSVAVGDSNGDGYDDLMISAPKGDNGGSNAGEVYVIWGKDYRSVVTAGSVGNSAANNLVGTNADDTLVGNGGADNFSAGAGDDIIEVTDLAFARIDGGRGIDTLSLTGSGMALSLQAYFAERFNGIEIIDLNDNGNSLSLDKLSLLMLSDEARTLYVKGGSSDYVTTDGSETWFANGTVVVDSITYVRYDLGQVSLFVQDVLSQPATPDAPTVDSISDDNGDVTDDGVTFDNTLIFSGASGAYFEVEIFIDSVSVGTVAADALGNWDFDYRATVLGDGTYSVTAVATNLGGYVSATSAALTVVVDTTAPSTPVVSAISNDTGSTDGVTSDTNLVISGTAEAGSTVEVFLDAASIGTTTADGASSWSFDYTGTTLPEGSYAITATANDGLNTSAGSVAFNITVDTTAPAAPVVASITDDSGLLADGITNDTTLIISGTSEPNASVQVFIGGGAIGATTAGGGGIWSFDYTGSTLSDGDYTITAQASDAAGNASVVSADFNITIDTSAPAVPTVDSISDDTGTGADEVTYDSQLLINGTADADATVSVSIDGGVIGSTTADGAGNWSFNHTGTTLADATYAITATAADTAGNTSSASSALTVTVDTDTPDISLLAPSNTATSVSFNSDLSIGFDEIVYEATGNIVLRYMSDDSAVETFDIAGGLVTGTGTSTITINPTANLYGGTQYYVEMDANSYTDLAGNDFAGVSGNATWAFTTTDTTITSSTPADEDSGVALNTTLSLNFNEAVTVNAGDVRIRRVSDDSTIDTIGITSGQVSGSGTTTIVITQSGVLSPNTAYYVEIDSGALVNGNNVSFAGISGSSTLNFTSANVSVPTVVDVTSSAADGNYNGNDTIPITVTFSEVVNVTGTPQIYIDLDSADKYINYVSGTGTTTLQFDYVVTTGDTKTDLAYVSTGALVLNGGSIRSANSANANLTLPSPGAANSLSNNKNINITAAALDITNLSASDGFFIEGSESLTVWFGHSISSGGDFNGDGFEDLVIGVPDSNLSNTSGGYAYLVYGQPGATRSGINMSAFGASDGIYVTGGDTADYLGSVVDISGDINGDGFNDFVVVSSRQNDGDSDAGAIYVIWGNASPVNIDVSTDFDTTVGVSNTDGFVILGTESSDEIGHYSTIDPQNAQFVDASGDFNGDGIQDILIGHNQSDFGSQTNAGVAYIIFGQTGSTRANFKLDTYSAEGFAFYNTSDSDNYVGHSVQYIGDFNGDGFNDVIIGAPEADGGDIDSGEAYVVFGNAGPTFSDVNLDTLNGSNGFIISSSNGNSQLGGSVSSADVNGDGLTDILIGVPQADTLSYTNNGAAIVIYGNSGPYSNIDLESVGSAGYVINGENDTDRSGHSVRGIKDLNGDGIDDFVLSTIHDDEGGLSAGAAWVIYGVAGTSRSDISLESLTSVDGFKIIGDVSGDEFGRSATSGDLNGDGYTDLMFSSVAGDNNGSHAGEVNVIWGRDFSALVDAGTSGDASANDLVGSDGDDTLIGNGGADNFSAGSGADIIEVSDLSFARINGGLGNDTLAITGSGLDLDLRTYEVETFRGIEIIDLRDNSNGLTLDKLSLLMLSNEVRTLYVKGGSSDFVATDGSETWIANGTSVVNTITYNRYDQGEVSLYIQDSLSQPATPSAPTVDNISDDTGIAADEITADSTLIFSGTTGAYFDVEVFIDAGSIGTATADASGNWSYDHTGVTLSDTTYSVTAIATNLGGYTSAASSALTVVVDAAAPAAPAVTAISDDTATADDGITSDTGLIFTGTAEATASVEVFINGGSIGTTTADGSGNWSLDHSSTTLADGSYTITAEASDAAGNTSATSADFNISVDATAPAAPAVTAISDDTGTAGDGITTDNTLIFSGTAEANTNVAVFIDAGSIGTTSADGSGNWSFDYTGTSLSDGDYTITAQAGDAAGNTSTVSAGFDITISSATPPTLNSSTPSDGVSLVALNTTITLNFNEAVTGGSGNITIHKASDGSVWDSIPANSAKVTGSGTTTIIVNQNDVLEPGTSYYINIDGNAFFNAGGLYYAGISNSTDLNFSTINTSTPTVTTVGSIKTDGTYGAGELIQIQVQFSELVYVTEGTPTLTLDLDGLDAVVNYASGSGTNTLVFDYTVAVGDATADLGYVDTSSLSLGDAKIRSNNYASADLTLASPGTVGSLSYNKDLVIAGDEIDISTIISGSDLGFAVLGDTASARLGQAVANAGDVNGDGFEDFVAGAPNANDGTAFVIWGKAGATRSNIDLASFTSSDGFAILGEVDTSASYDNQLGISVGGVGDLNGDGYDDIMVIAAGHDNSEADDAGTAYVIWGKAGATRADVDTASFSSSDGFRILGAETATRLGYADNGEGIASGGDFNGDGIDDLLIGHIYSSLDAGNGGQAYLVFGKSGATRDDVILSEEKIGRDGFLIGNGASDALGQGLNFVGDFNGDGYDDIAVGATNNDIGNTDAGIAYVIFGNRGPIFPDLDLSALTNSQMFMLYSSENSAKLGHSISSGDVNGDGLSDLLLSANYMDYNSVSDAGAVYVIYGYRAASYPALEVETLAAGSGYVIHGDTNDRLGSSVSGGGDFNADGIDDLLVSARLDTNDASNFSGSAWIIFGMDGTTRGDVDLATLSSIDGFKLKSTVATDYFGSSTDQCDINGDGFQDLLVGAYFSDPNTINQAGEVITLWGYDFYGDVLNLSGDANDNNIIGTSGADSISAGGGSDAVSAGSGDDTIALGDTSFYRINGGRGVDTLSFSNGGNTLDLGAINPMTISSIEVIDLGDLGNDLTVTRNSVRALSRQTNILYVKGGSSDSVSQSTGDAWVYGGSENVGGIDYEVYVDEGALLYVQNTISMTSLASFTSTQTYTFDTTASGADVAGDVTDFPVLIRVSAGIVADLQGDFDDIRFLDADQRTLLPYEVEEGNSGELYVWVRVPQVDGNSNTDHVEMHYNDTVNGSVPDFQNAATLWEDYAGVWHLDEGVSGTAYDSSPYENHATEADGAGSVVDNTDKLIGNGRYFSNSRLEVAYHHSINVDLKPFTIEFWVKERALDGTSSSANKLLYRGLSTNYWKIDGKHGTSGSPLAPNMVMAENGFLTTRLIQSGDPNLANSVWVHMMAVYNPTDDTVKMYADGVQQGADGNGRNVENGLSFFMGSSDADHQMDEVRYGRYVADDNRVKLTYENQKAVGSLVSPQF